ncbi:MAG TPA: type I restriction-modification enzyme R subunit C-terminal domain-containing protein [Candidatus Saccharibacteria bacterium]|nr:type I restriction-modification enzyme R subunit C-terminal domain-containing protein [Candidatus Saccharibacteria bacterium]
MQIIDAEGKLITESLTDYTKRNILGEYATLDEFLQTWQNAKQRYYILEELENKGVPLSELREKFGGDMDLFDLVLHIAYDQKPLKRSDRAESVRRSKFFNEYQGRAREVLEALLDKYESASLKTIEDPSILRLKPIDQFGTPVEIAQLFGGIEHYQTAVNQLEEKIYERAGA